MKKTLLFVSVLLFGSMYGVPYDVAIAWLKGTYEPFAAAAQATQALSPFIGATSWHSGWIAGLHTWGGVRVKEVHGDRTHFKLVEGDEVVKLVDALFQNINGAITPTHTNHPYYLLLTTDKDPDGDLLGWFFDLVRNKTVGQASPVRKQLIADWVAATGCDKAALTTFLNKLGKTFDLCGDGKRYPVFVPQQILAAFAYVTLVRQASTVDEWLAHLARYMKALGQTHFQPTLYDSAVLRERVWVCPLAITEEILAKKLYGRVGSGAAPLIEWSFFDYRQAHRGNCVETMLLNFFNVILYDSATGRYRLDLLPPAIQATLGARLRNFYEKHPLVTDTAAGTINDWLEATSGIEGGVSVAAGPEQQAALDAHNIVYLQQNTYTYEGQTKTTLFEFASDKRNVLAIINYLLGTQAKNFVDLGRSLFVDRPSMSIAQTRDGFLVESGGIVVRFNILSGHSYAVLSDECWEENRVMFGYSLANLQYCCLIKRFPTKPLIGQLRYLLYAAGTTDLAFLADALNKLFERNSEYIVEEKAWILGLIKELMLMVPDYSLLFMFDRIFDQPSLINSVNGEAENVALLTSIVSGSFDKLMPQPVDADAGDPFWTKVFEAARQLPAYNAWFLQLLWSNVDPQSLTDFDGWRSMLKVEQESDIDDAVKVLVRLPNERKNQILVEAIEQNKRFLVDALMRAGATLPRK